MLSREQYLVVQGIQHGVLAADTLFAAADHGEDTEPCNRPGYLDTIATALAERVSRGQVENALSILAAVLKQHA